MSNLSYGAGTNLGPIQCTKNSYQIFRELHSPEHVYADTYLILEKVMDLGVKDLYYKGERTQHTAKPKNNVDDLIKSARSSKEELKRER